MTSCNEPTICHGRREFLVRSSVGLGGLLLTISTLGKGSPFEDVVLSIGNDSRLAKVGGFDYADSSAGKLIVIRTGETAFAAFSAVCTHKRGLLEYVASSNKLACPKHGSEFSARDGKVTNGPADTPIASYSASGDKNSVKISVG